MTNVLLPISDKPLISLLRRGRRLTRGPYVMRLIGCVPLALLLLIASVGHAQTPSGPPSVGVVRDRLITGIARGYGELDWTALGLVAAEEAGLYAVPSVAAD